jgi:hypothetical protein
MEPFNTDNEILTKDTRSINKRTGLKKEKFLRKIKASNYDDDRGRKMNDAISNPTNYQKRWRSESPPPKSKRTNKGCNKGHANACPFCRPEICKRLLSEATVKNYIRELEINEYVMEENERNINLDLDNERSIDIYYKYANTQEDIRATPISKHILEITNEKCIEQKNMDENK